MKILYQLGAGYLLLIYPMAAMMSPMMFDAPDSMSDPSKWLTVCCVLLYPALVGYFLYRKGVGLFWLSPARVLVVTCTVAGLAFTTFGWIALNDLANETRKHARP